MKEEEGNTSEASIGNNAFLGLNLYEPEIDGRLGEIFGLASGIKKAAFLKIKDEKEIDLLLKRVKELSPERDFQVAYSDPQDWLLEIAGNYKKNAFVGEDQELLSRLKEISELPREKFSHPEMGKLLSYPECCADTLDYRMDAEDVFSLGRVNDIDYRINNFYIRTDNNVVLVKHYVCSYECQATISYTQGVLEFLSNFPEIYSFLVKELKRPLAIQFFRKNTERATGEGAVFVFDGHYEDKNNLWYKRVYYLPKHTPEETDKSKEQDVLKKLLKGNRIVIGEDGKADVYMDDELKDSFDSSLTAFIRFF